MLEADAGGRPGSVRRKAFATVAVLGAVVLLGLLGTFAAFTATTANTGNQVQSGTVALSDNDSGSALYSATGQKPGDVTERCLKVTYDGSLDSTVKLYASAVGAFGNNVDLTVTPGSTAAGFSGCGTFTPDGGGAIYTGTLKGFGDSHTDYTSGLTDYPGSTVRWAQGDTVAYRFTLTVKDNIPNNGATAALASGSHDFTFEARQGQYAKTVLGTSGLVSYWRLGETSGTTANDAKGANNGTYNGGPALNQPGAQTDGDPAISYDGIDDYTEVPNSPSLNPSNITVEAWVKSNTPTWNTNGFVVAKRPAYVVHPYAGTKNFALVLYSGGLQYGSTWVPPASFDIALWHHYVGTYDGTNGRFYVDGILRKTFASPPIDTGDTGPLQIGRDDLPSRFGNANLDEVAIYNRALTATEIQDHYNAR